MRLLCREENGREKISIRGQREREGEGSMHRRSVALRENSFPGRASREEMFGKFTAIKPGGNKSVRRPGKKVLPERGTRNFAARRVRVLLRASYVPATVKIDEIRGDSGRAWILRWLVRKTEGNEGNGDCRLGKKLLIGPTIGAFASATEIDG